MSTAERADYCARTRVPGGSPPPEPPISTATPSSPQLRHRIALVLIGVLTTIVTWYGWRVFLFITDDAYIAFRYVSNSILGRGLVWNPEPFKPVEGYTSFLWVMVLREVWAFTGIEPPESANVLSLLCGFGTLFLVARMWMRCVLPPKWERSRLVLLALILLATVTNRTFLTWLSSGLETAFFNLLFTWWVFEGTARVGRDRASWTFRLSLSAALTALCRPDGMLMVMATVVMLVLEPAQRRVRTVLAASPLLLLPAHLLWRWRTYHDWVPNTYYAKYVAAWPESGARYLASFIVEYGVWWWILLAIVWFVHLIRTERNAVVLADAARWIPVAVLLTHLGYYTFLIGGDHFEYRVYSHLVPLLFLSAAWMATRLTARPAMGAALLVGFMLVSWPVQWTHWAVQRNAIQRHIMLVTPIADRFPWPLRPVVAQYDEWQDWMIKHFVCMRQQEHKAATQILLSTLPSRTAGLKIPWTDHPTLPTEAVGVVAWVLPNVAIIDLRGLNDRIVARHPVSTASEDRQMAQDRRPPEGYADCFRPNVVRFPGRPLAVQRRPAPLTDEDIRACEEHDWERPVGEN